MPVFQEAAAEIFRNMERRARHEPSPGHNKLGVDTLSMASMAAASGEECVAFDINRSHKPVFHALVDARSKFGADKVGQIDGDERALT